MGVSNLEFILLVFFICYAFIGHQLALYVSAYDVIWGYITATLPIIIIIIYLWHKKYERAIKDGKK